MTSAISLFSSAGIGDLAFKRKNIDVLIANELLDDRCDICLLYTSDAADE